MGAVMSGHATLKVDGGKPKYPVDHQGILHVCNDLLALFEAAEQLFHAGKLDQSWPEGLYTAWADLTVASGGGRWVTKNGKRVLEVSGGGFIDEDGTPPS